MQVLELNPEDPIAKKSIARLQPIVAERQEKMKDEMLGAVLSCIPGFHVCNVTWAVQWQLLMSAVHDLNVAIDQFADNPGWHCTTRNSKHQCCAAQWHEQLRCQAQLTYAYQPVTDKGIVHTGKLKDLGNTVLGKFGMSLDNFKADKDPNTGSYSINFKQ